MIKLMEQLLEKFSFPVVQLPLFNGTGNETGLKAIYRHDPEKNYHKNWLGHHTTDYVVTTNQRIIEAAFGILDSTGLNVNEYDPKNSWISKDLKRMSLSLVTDEKFSLNDKDQHNLTINMKNSYDGSFAFDSTFGTYRLICSNGAFIGEILTQYKRKHVNEFSPELLKHRIMIAIEKFPKLKHVYENMQNSEMSKAELDSIFEAMEKRNLTSKSDSQNMQELAGVEKNAYSLMTIFTYYLTHIVNSREKAIKVNQFMMEKMGRKYV